MLSLSKKKINKEYIYVRKHNTVMYSIEDVLLKYKKSQNKIEDTVLFFSNKIPYDKLTFVMKIIFHSDGKTVLDIDKVKNYINQMLVEAIENFVANPTDSSYVSDSIVLIVSSYGGKHYISICPRYDFVK